MLNALDNITISHNHPIWINNDQNRIFPRDLPSVTCENLNTELYNIQFEDEDTFYAEGVKIDSLSPFNSTYYLEEELYFNKDKFISNHCVTGEDDLKRNKPKIIN